MVSVVCTELNLILAMYETSKWLKSHDGVRMMKTEQEWLDFEQRMIEMFDRNGWHAYGKFARNPDGSLLMHDDVPVSQSLLDLFAECDAHRAKLVERGINPHDEI